MIPFLDLSAEYTSIKDDIDKAITGVISETAFSSGRYVKGFEEAFSKYLGGGTFIGCSSGTSALRLAFESLFITKGHEVIIPANTFIATAEAICHIGASPVLVDCNEDDFLIDTSKIEAAITENTKAIVPVHLYGQTADMDKIIDIARRYNLLVIEDSCQAHGGMYKGRMAGTIGDFGCFSFYPGKNLGAYGEAGGIWTRDEDRAETIRMLISHGEKGKYNHQLIGYNDRMDGIQGAVLSAKLKHLNKWNEQRRVIADNYRALLADSGLILPLEHKEGKDVYHLFVIRTKERDRILHTLTERRISCGIHYPKAIHQHQAFKNYSFFDRDVDYPVSSRLVGEILSLPVFPQMTMEQIQIVVSTLKSIL